jgi:ABC-type uncharacterized transport system permease subunit
VTAAHQAWRWFHYCLLLLGAVGVSVGCVASIMYLLQARRLKVKAIPGDGLRLLSLERLEQMNQRALHLAFPLLTAGVLVGIGMMADNGAAGSGWMDARILSTTALWLVFALLLTLHHALRLRGRPMAFLTIGAFMLLLLSLASSHFRNEAPR